MLLINPRARRKARKPSPAQVRARKAFGAAAKARVGSRKRRRNPIAAPASAARVRAARRAARRSNPVGRVHRSRRRRNPIGGSSASYINMIKAGAIGGAGAIAVDLLMGQINGFLPATLQRTPGQVGVGDAVKMALTVVAGKALSRQTKGLSMQAAHGALVVQMHGILAQFVPGTMTLGYATAAPIANMSARIGPNRRLSQYTPSGAATPLLSRYSAGASPLLSGRADTMARESMVR